MFGPTHRWEIERLHKRVGRSCRTIASRPTRLCRRTCRNIQSQDSRYDRGTAGGQVMSGVVTLVGEQGRRL